MLRQQGYDIEKQHLDCGMLIYDENNQGHRSRRQRLWPVRPRFFAAHILPKLEQGEWRRVLFVPTGALMSKVSFYEGQTVPGIAQAVLLESTAKEA